MKWVLLLRVESDTLLLSALLGRQQNVVLGRSLVVVLAVPDHGRQTLAYQRFCHIAGGNTHVDTKGDMSDVLYQLLVNIPFKGYLMSNNLGKR